MDNLLSQQVHQMIKRGEDAIMVFQQYGNPIVETVQASIEEARANRGDGVVVVTEDLTKETVSIEKFPLYVALKDLMDLLAYRLGLLKQADLEVHREKKETHAAQTKRDLAVAHVRDRLIRLRSNLDGVYGATFSDSIGLSGSTPEDPKMLEHVVRALFKTVSKKGFSLPTALDAEMPLWTVDTLQSYLAKLIAPLEEATLELSRESKEDQAAQIRRRSLLESTRQATTAFTSTLETLARLALLPEVADRIRPVSRLSTPEEDPSTDQPDGSTPTTPATPAASDTPVTPAAS